MVSLQRFFSCQNLIQSEQTVYKRLCEGVENILEQSFALKLSLTFNHLLSAIVLFLTFSDSISFTKWRIHTHTADADTRAAQSKESRSKKRKRSLLKKSAHITFRTHCNIEWITQIKRIFVCLPNYRIPTILRILYKESQAKKHEWFRLI